MPTGRLAPPPPPATACDLEGAVSPPVGSASGFPSLPTRARSTGHTRPLQAPPPLHTHTHTKRRHDGVPRSPTLRCGPRGLSSSARPWNWTPRHRCHAGTDVRACNPPACVRPCPSPTPRHRPARPAAPCPCLTHLFHSPPQPPPVTPHPTPPHPSLYPPPPPCAAPRPREGMDTQYTHHGHKWGMGGGGAHDALATRRTERGNRQPEVVVCPRWGSDPAGRHPGAQKPPLGRGPPPPVWGCPLRCTWPTARAVALLRVDPTQSSETGRVRGLRWQVTVTKGKEG